MFVAAALILGSLSTSTWYVPRNRRGPCKFVPCRRLLQRREAAMREIGPPDQSPRDLQWPLAQARPSAELKKKRRPSQTQFSISLRLPNYTSSTQVTSSLRNSIAVSPSLLPVCDSVAASVQPKRSEACDIASYSVPAQKTICR